MPGQHKQHVVSGELESKLIHNCAVGSGTDGTRQAMMVAGGGYLAEAKIGIVPGFSFGMGPLLAAPGVHVGEIGIGYVADKR